ncbi:MAG: hypothetical protein KatS3mg129_1058 [Leptospiraceae bacterium]|nr:MAG: hypothetical protein KatS3mg129_1058 [Leptospiraceae bacterium]
MKDSEYFRENYERSRTKYIKERDRYLPLIQNFVDNFLAVFLEPSVYYQNVKNYISLQIRYRVKYFILGLLFFLISFYFIFFFIGFLFFSGYQFLLTKIDNHALIAFLIGWISFLIFFIVLYLSFHFFYKIGQNPLKQKTRRKI